MTLLSGSILKKQGFIDFNFSFTFEKENTVIRGESGAGKTTFLNMISGIECPDEGKLYLGNTVLYDSERGINLPVRNRKIGHVFQQPYLFPHKTVEANIAFSKKETMETAWMKELLKETGVLHLLEAYPENLSGGEKQRVNLLRSLASEPRLLLLDEPFSSLDSSMRRSCQDLLLHYGKGIPFVLVTHDDQEAERVGEEHFLLEDGRIHRNVRKIGGFTERYQGDA